ncbi:MAG: alpha-2-macroglobulin family protein, partial [bacterium]
KDLGNLWVYSESSYTSALSQGKIKTYKDPWGNNYTLAVGTNQVSLTTRGPDKKSGTLDDITYTLQYEQVYKPNPAPVRQQVPIGGGLWGGLWGMPFVGGQFFAPAPMLDINRNAQGLAYGAYASAAYGGTGGTVDAGGTYVAQTKQGFMSSPEQGGETPSEGTEETVEPRRVRRDFPETLLWEPCLITDPNGTAFLDANMADSITTWRMSTMASGMDGSLGGNTDGIVVFQEFFIDLDLPVALTRNDEISLPVAIYNYLEDSQSVRIVIDTNNPWFELLDTSEKEVDLEPGQVTSVHFRIRAQEVGWHELTVFGYGTSMSDAIARTIEVLPDGLEFNTSISDRLAGSSIERTVTIPADAIDNASRILVKVYPGIFSQVVEGLDNLFRVPHGCFTQSTTITWPNVLVLDYMLTTDQITPEIEMKAREYVNLGYQRLLTFECPNGGFSWYGNEPAKPVLTAYGLMEFTDMARVQYVDPAMIQRTQEWLVGKQQNDGSWPPDQVRELFNVLSNNLQATAYAVWALIHSGYSAQHQKIIKGLDYVRANWDGVQDNYTLALCAHALLEANTQDSTGLQILDILESTKIVEGDTIHWTSTQPSMTYSRGGSLTLETTAMITLALMKAGWRYPQSINGAINYIIQHRDAFGNWGQTQATVLCLRVLMTAMSGQTQEMEGDIVIAINGQTLDYNDLPVLRITPVDSSVVRLIDLKPYTTEGDNQVGISLVGEGNLLYQIVGSYFLPWQGVGIPTSPQLKIDLTYDRQNLTVDDIILCTVTATNTVPGSVTQMGMLDLGIPPGFRIFWEDFEAAIEEGKIFKYESTNRQLTLYLHPLPYNEPLSITYRLQAKYPLKVTTPRSRVYDYFNPDIGNETRPVILTVTD